MDVWWIGLACFVAIYAVATVWSRAAARRAERAFPPAGQFVTVEGASIHYVRRGAGRPIVLLHGSDGFLQDFAMTVLDRLAAEFDAIAMDRPGHGYSALPEGECASAPAQARLIHAALADMGVERPILVGHSWSGLLLLYYAWRYPDDIAGLVLLAPWIYPGRLGEPLLRALSQPWLAQAVHPLFALVRPLVVRWFLRDAFAPDPVPREYRRQAEALWLRSSRQLAATARENSGNRSALAGFSPALVPPRVPILISAGGRDRVTPPLAQARRLQAEMPHSMLTILEDVGHELMHTEPDAVIGLVRACAEAAASPDAAEPAPGAKGAPAPRDRARELVLRFGWNATAYQILNPQIDLWFAADGEACVGYVHQAGVRVVAGAPVCAEERLGQIVAAFETEAAGAGESVCYFGAADRLYHALDAAPGHSAVAIGAQPSWRPDRWQGILKRHRSLRAQLNRARNKGVAVAERSPAGAAADASLQRCLAEWNATHAGFELHFLTEPIPLDRLADRRLFVANRDGEAVGFLVATPVPDRNGWLVEQIVRGAGAPNGTAELLIDGLMRAAADEGCGYITLGLAPLSRRAAPARWLWLRLLLAWIRAHGRRFYNFEGLDAFKAKFQPDAWEPIYAISNEPAFSVRTLYGIAGAFTAGAPLAAIARALVAAVRQELRWLRRPPETRALE